MFTLARYFFTYYVCVNSLFFFTKIVGVFVSLQSKKERVVSVREYEREWERERELLLMMNFSLSHLCRSYLHNVAYFWDNEN